MKAWRWTLRIQGGYYVATGLWPWLSLSSFEAVTGPKIDDWLVQTVGALAAAIGVTLVVAGCRASPAPDAKLLSALSAIAFGGVDLLFVLRGIISPIYLVDAFLQGCLLLVAPAVSLKSWRDNEEARRQPSS